MANEKTIKAPNEQSFSLSKAKLDKDGGITVIYEVTEVVGEESYTNKFQVESAKEVHPDLKDLFDRLRPILGRIFNITSFLSMLDVKEFKATDKQKEYGRDFSNEMLKNIEVRGVSLSGQGDNVGMVLTGLFTVSNNQKTAINSPRLKFNSETFGFEEELEEIAADIETEVYAFLFKGKKAQLELFGEHSQDDEHQEHEESQTDLFPSVADPADDAEEETEEIEETEVEEVEEHDDNDEHEDYDDVRDEM